MGFEIAIVLLIIAGIFIMRTIKVVPQQHAWVIERLGKYHATLTPGLNFLVPFIDKVAYKHVLKEITEKISGSNYRLPIIMKTSDGSGR